MDNSLHLTATTPRSKRRFIWLRSLFSGFINSLERARTRRLLGQLNDQQLSDLGITHSDRLQELDKPFWR